MIKFSQMAFAEVHFREQLSDSLNIFRGKFSCSTATTLLYRSVSRIISVCSKPQMFWPNATPNVAAVQNPHSFRNRTKVQNPTSAMGSNLNAGFVAFFNQAVTSFRECRPHPALSQLREMWRYWSVLIDLGPKAFLEFLGKPLLSQVLGGNLNHFHSRLRRLGYWPSGAFLV